MRIQLLPDNRATDKHATLSGPTVCFTTAPYLDCLMTLVTLKTKNQIQFICLILVQSSSATTTKFYSFILLFWVR